MERMYLVFGSHAHYRFCGPAYQFYEIRRYLYGLTAAIVDVELFSVN